MRRCSGMSAEAVAALLLCLLPLLPPLPAAGAPGDDRVLPELGLDTYVGRCLNIVDQEIAQLTERASLARPPRRDVLLAAVATRRLAGRLLENSDTAGGDAALQFVAGFTLFRGRDEIDATLAGLVELLAEGEVRAPVDPELRRRAEWALREVTRFTDAVAALPEPLQAAAGPSAPAPAVDRAVAAVLAPLAAAVHVVSAGAGAGDHWIAPASSEPAANLPERLAGLSRRLPAAPVDEPARRALEEILDFLERGSRFADLQPAAAAHADLIAEVLDLADAVAAAAWLSGEQQAAIQERLRSALADFRRASSRDEAERRLHQLAMARSVIEKVTALSRPGDDELEPVRAGFLAGFGAGSEQWTEAQRQRLNLLLDRLIAYRALNDDAVPQDLRAVRKKLDASYRQAEKALLRQAETLMSRPDALTDPAFSTLVASQAQYLTDLQRVGAAADWIGTISLAAPAAAPAVSSQIRRWCQWLVEPNRRPQAIEIMDRLQDQIRRFHPLPGEDALRRGDASAVTGGLDRDLIATIDKARQAWGGAWGEGTGDADAARRMALLERLCRAIAGLAAAGTAADAPVLDAWAPWELNQGTCERMLSDMPGRLKLATAAAVAGDDRELSVQLDRIESGSPPAILIATLAARLGPRLALLPAGAAGTLGQLVEPAPETWPLDRRRDLALFCRATLELEYARATGRGELESSLRVFVNDVADDLVQAGW